jgi:hypothetical protein
MLSSQVRLRYDAPVAHATFDDPNLVSCAGLAPVMRLAEQAGLYDVAGMLAGADSIDDLDIAWYGGMRLLFTNVYAPSTLGSFLRT